MTIKNKRTDFFYTSLALFIQNHVRRGIKHAFYSIDDFSIAFAGKFESLSRFRVYFDWNRITLSGISVPSAI